MFRAFLFTITVLMVTALAVAQAPSGTQNPATGQAPSTEQAPSTAPVPPVAPAPAYTPRFKGDPAHSDAEAAALGYMRTVNVAEKLYKKKHNEYASTLKELVGHGSFTRRMLNPDRGDYTVHFKGTPKQYSLTVVPKQFDAAHRAFYTNELGTIRVEDDGPASETSPRLKAD